jgi:hypothetical protein
MPTEIKYGASLSMLDIQAERRPFVPPATALTRPAPASAFPRWGVFAVGIEHALVVAVESTAPARKIED